MGTVWTGRYTPTEAAALTELPEKQVRKEIEHQVIEAESPPRLPFAALVYLRALKLMEMHLSVDDRTRISRRVIEAVHRSRQMGGEPVFPDSRLTVRRVGAYPRVGRPRSAPPAD